LKTKTRGAGALFPSPRGIFTDLFHPRPLLIVRATGRQGDPGHRHAGGSLVSMAATGRKMRFTGVTVLRLKNGKIVEEIGLDDGVTALTQLGLITAA
jgi:hypothetical protein